MIPNSVWKNSPLIPGTETFQGVVIERPRWVPDPSNEACSELMVKLNDEGITRDL